MHDAKMNKSYKCLEFIIYVIFHITRQENMLFVQNVIDFILNFMYEKLMYMQKQI